MKLLLIAWIAALHPAPHAWYKVETITPHGAMPRLEGTFTNYGLARAEQNALLADGTRTTITPRHIQPWR